MLVERKSKQKAIDDRPEPMSPPINIHHSLLLNYRQFKRLTYLPNLELKFLNICTYDSFIVVERLLLGVFKIILLSLYINAMHRYTYENLIDSKVC